MIDDASDIINGILSFWCLENLNQLCLRWILEIKHNLKPTRRLELAG